jgi:hypothetical protein
MRDLEWTITSWTDEQWRAAHRWENLSAGERAELLARAWEKWVIASCVERNRGHQWWLDWDADEGLWLHCQHCPAGVDELYYPDGQDLIYGGLPLPDGRKLVIDSGSAPLDAPCQEWHGPVRAWVEETYHPGGLWGGPEWDAWVIVEAS